MFVPERPKRGMLVRQQTNPPSQSGPLSYYRAKTNKKVNSTHHLRRLLGRRRHLLLLGQAEVGRGACPSEHGRRRGCVCSLDDCDYVIE